MIKVGARVSERYDHLYETFGKRHGFAKARGTVTEVDQDDGTLFVVWDDGDAEAAGVGAYYRESELEVVS